MYDYLWLNASLSNGGSERVMTLLANAFAERGLKSKMVLLRAGKDGTYATSPKLTVQQMTYQTKNRALLFLIRWRRIRKMVRKEKPKCVICFMWDLNALTLLACLGLKCKVLVSERAYPPMARQGLHRWFTEHCLYRTAHRVVFQTEQVKQFFTDQVKRRSVVIPNPINAEIREPWEGERKKEVVSAGRFVNQKNFSLLMRSFAAFRGTHPEWKLTIYGDGRLREKLETEAKELGIDDAVSMPGFVENLPDRMRESGMYVSSSDFEGISNVMLEAMASGLPSICTDCPVGGASLAIQDGVNGLLVPVGGEREITAAMGRIADEPEMAARIGREAVKVRERFSIDTIVQKWVDACEAK